MWERFCARFAKLFENSSIGKTVVKHLVDLLADGLRQPGHFPVARMLMPSEEAVDGRDGVVRAGGAPDPLDGIGCGKGSGSSGPLFWL